MSANKPHKNVTIPGAQDEVGPRRLRGGNGSTRSGATGFAAFLDPTTEDSQMKIRPLQDRVIVKRVKEDEKTKGGLYIPDTAKEKPIEGTVVAVGNGKVLEDGSVRKLDIRRVIASSSASTRGPR